MNKAKFISGLAAIVVTHGAAIALGTYHGNLKANGIEPTGPMFGYVWVANMASTGLAQVLLDREEISTGEKLMNGGLLGGFTAPIAYSIAFGVGYLAGNLYKHF